MGANRRLLGPWLTLGGLVAIPALLVLLWLWSCDFWLLQPSCDGKTFTQWTYILEHGDEKTRLEALYAIETMPLTYGIPNRLPIALEKTLQEERNLELRLRALQIASWIGGMGKGAQMAPAVANLLSDDDPRIQNMAASTLGALKNKDQEIIDSLKNTMHNSVPNVQITAAVSYAKLGGNPEEALTVIKPFLDIGDNLLTNHCIEALGIVGGLTDGRETVNLLMPFLKDEDTAIKTSAVVALTRHGVKAAEASAGLLQLLEDVDPEIRREAVCALVTVKPGESKVIAAIIKSLKDGDSGVRTEAVWALKKNGQGTTEIITALIGTLDDPSGYVRGQTAQVLGKFKAQLAIPKLVKAKGDSDSYYRAFAAVALGEIGVNSPEVCQALKEMKNDENADVRKDATTALARLGCK